MKRHCFFTLLKSIAFILVAMASPLRAADNAADGAVSWFETTYKPLRTSLAAIAQSAPKRYADPISKLTLVSQSIAFFLLVYALMRRFSSSLDPGEAKKAIVAAVVFTGLIAAVPWLLTTGSAAADDISTMCSYKSGGLFGASDLTMRAAMQAACGWQSGITPTAAIINLVILLGMGIAIFFAAASDILLLAMLAARELILAFSAALLPAAIAFIAVGALADMGAKWISGIVGVLLWLPAWGLAQILAGPVLDLADRFVASPPSEAGYGTTFPAILALVVVAAIGLLATLLSLYATKIVSGSIVAGASGAARGAMGAGKAALAIPSAGGQAAVRAILAAKTAGASEAAAQVASGGSSARDKSR